MKKVNYILAVPMVIVTLGITVLVLVKNDGKTVSATDCPTLAKQQLSSERSLGLIIENRRLLAVKLGGEGEKNYSPPGGHVEASETYQQALEREFQEEINLKVNQADLSQFRITCEPRYGSVERTYYYLINKWDGVISVDDKSNGLKWVNYSYHTNKKADTELKTALLFSKEANLID